MQIAESTAGDGRIGRLLCCARARAPVRSHIARRQCHQSGHAERCGREWGAAVGGGGGVVVGAAVVGAAVGS